MRIFLLILCRKWELKIPNNELCQKTRFSDREVIFWQTLLVLDQFGCVLLISELRIEFWSILRRFLAQKSKMPFFHAKNGILELNLAWFVCFCQNMAPCAKKNVSWGSQAHKTHTNYPQIKGFALKHHQNDSRQLFAKVKILQYFHTPHRF